LRQTQKEKILVKQKKINEKTQQKKNKTKPQLVM